MKRHVFIEGKVQGVSYRAYTKKKAEELGIKGWVKNLLDSRVEAVFQGPKTKVEKMIKWCWKGSPASRVSKVEQVSKEETYEDLKGFAIRY